VQRVSRWSRLSERQSLYSKFAIDRVRIPIYHPTVYFYDINYDRSYSRNH
jgi:hypothetical protein